MECFYSQWLVATQLSKERREPDGKGLTDRATFDPKEVLLVKLCIGIFVGM